MNKSNEKIVKCVGCQKKFIYSQSQYRPFCSIRCKEIDLGHWLSESYTVAGEEIKKSDEEE